MGPTFTADTLGEDTMKSGRLDLWGSQPADSCTGNAFWGCTRSAPDSGNFLKETGFGQLSGSFQKTMLTVNGQHPVKLISLNPEVTLALESPEVVNLSEQLFIGDQTTTMTLTRKPLPSINTQSPLETTSMSMDLTGARMVSNLPS